MSTSNLNETLSLRVNLEMFNKFKAKCDALGRPYYSVLRELMTAFAEGRVTIKVPPSQQKTLKEIYSDD